MFQKIKELLLKEYKNGKRGEALLGCIPANLWSSKDCEGRTPLAHVLWFPSRLKELGDLGLPVKEIWDRLISAEGVLSAKDDRGRTLFAYVLGCSSCLKNLGDLGLPVKEIWDQLISAEGVLSAKDKQVRTPLAHVLWFPSCLKELGDLGLPVKEIWDRLISAEGVLIAKDEDGRTPLAHVLWFPSCLKELGDLGLPVKEIWDRLISAEGVLTTKDKQGRTPFELALNMSSNNLSKLSEILECTQAALLEELLFFNLCVRQQGKYIVSQDALQENYLIRLEAILGNSRDEVFQWLSRTWHKKYDEIITKDFLTSRALILAQLVRQAPVYDPGAAESASGAATPKLDISQLTRLPIEILACIVKQMPGCDGNPDPYHFFIIKVLEDALEVSDETREQMIERNGKAAGDVKVGNVDKHRNAGAAAADEKCVADEECVADLGTRSTRRH